MPKLWPVALLLTTAAGALAAQAPASRGDAWWAHVEALANDGMEGRLTGSPGHQRAADYIVKQLTAIGLKPAGVNGFYQPVALIDQSFIAAESSAALVGPAGEMPLAVPTDVYFRGGPMPETVDAPLVFAGYGLHIPEAGYDDFKGLDLKGKVVVVLSGGPADISGALKSSARSERGKYLAEQGAVGVIALTTPKQVEIPWTRQVLLSSAPSMFFADPALRDVATPLMAATLDVAKAPLLFAGAKLSFDELSALSDASKPVPTFALTPRFKAKIVARRKAVASTNLVAKLPGSDPKLAAEHVVLSAHFDGLGVGQPINGDAIYNGALDNASGVASLLEIAKTLTASKVKPKRSILFTFVTGEEKGLLGSRYFAKRPSVPAASLVADLNFDMALPIFALKAVTPLGYEESSLGTDAKAVSAEMGLPILPDPFPDRNTFIRSDQYSFIREGIPALFFKYGFTAGTPEAAAEKAWRANIYHSPADDLKQPVMKEEAVKLDDYVAALALRVANGAARPAWNEASFFKRFVK
ncbi:M28 family metallopeptidase [Sphingomonas naphthae]|uniref:M28 family metallopeptidase n=1 Tax=Sphingomonas naphthae TaxID=1813468 RepID=A0ABY7TFL5_9SPHN|nr:M28 family metallopeptidase [Sphingomonas naphthae]WCT71848.1 M28 family metallopeptidase [Sphingomonas naphthae]